MNQICLVGRLTSTPAFKSTPSGKAVCNFSLAVERRFKDADGKPITDFIDCVAWSSQAEFLCKWFDKGVRVGLTGELQTRTYTDKDGNNRKMTEVLVGTVEFADGKRDATNNANTNTGNTNTFARNENNNVDEWVPVDDVDLPF